MKQNRSHKDKVKKFMRTLKYNAVHHLYVRQQRVICFSRVRDFLRLEKLEKEGKSSLRPR